jgi:hypothetical protein
MVGMQYASLMGQLGDKLNRLVNICDRLMKDAADRPIGSTGAFVGEGTSIRGLRVQFGT